MRWAAFPILVFAGCGGPTWSDDERDILATMAAVQTVSSDPTIAWADDPEAAGLRRGLSAVVPPVEAPPRKGEHLTAVREAWDRTDGDEDVRLAAAMNACVGCHAD